ncbi:hypothetical protein Y1Q_0000136 [Alligator mississippiensis]|uniref:Uncharacterized protein n=1 Tax=Alligator mississippiensis TaxID=8496 RepID=A0A151MM05_ALLMI|nr:hypothetical protein Y1Q_0000136 [Alligator mississippiensis]
MSVPCSAAGAISYLGFLACVALGPTSLQPPGIARVFQQRSPLPPQQGLAQHRQPFGIASPISFSVAGLL